MSVNNVVHGDGKSHVGYASETEELAHVFAAGWCRQAVSANAVVALGALLGEGETVEIHLDFSVSRANVSLPPEGSLSHWFQFERVGVKPPEAEVSAGAAFSIGLSKA